MIQRTTRRDAARRKGVVLIAVLIVVMLLGLAATQFSDSMSAEYKATMSYTRSVQARAAAESGVSYAAMLLSDPNAFQNTLGGNPFDNPERFHEIPVGGSDEGAFQAHFSVVAPLGPDDSASSTMPYRFGATDESGKINVNSLLKLDSSGGVAVEILKKIGIPQETANAILDWIDTDTTPRPGGGAEDETYSPQGYRTKNGPLDTLEELLYVKGVTPELLFGNDRNRNGVLDADEMTTGGQLDLGWQAYLTVYSREQNIDKDGNPRLYINTRNTLTLYSKLVDAVGLEMANYLLAYRRYGPAPSQLPTGPITTVTADKLERRVLQRSLFNGGRNLSSLFVLVGSEVLIPGQGQGSRPMKVASPLNDPAKARELLPLILEKLSTSADQDIPARINVNTAPRAVLAALPGVTEADVETIVSSRPDASSLFDPDPIYQTPAWLYTEANLSPQTLATLDRFVSARTQAYRIQVVGYFPQGGPTARVEAIIDTNRGRPRVVYWRDLSELGRGFDLQMNQKGP